MENKIFKSIVDENIKKIGFEKKLGAWLKETQETIIALILRKSGYSNYYYLRIKVNIKPFNEEIDKEWIKHDIADILFSFDSDHKILFNLENNLNDQDRQQKLISTIQNVLKEICLNLSSKDRIIELAKKKEVFLLPYTKEKLGIIN